MISEEDISGKVMDHLGLVAVTLEKIGLIEKIDARLPLNNSKTTMGQRVAAMIFNGLGFIDDRLYMFPQFLDNKPVDRLFKGDVKAEYFNDDALGRCLDAIDEYGNHWTAEMRTDVEQWTTYSQMWNEDPQQPVKL